jgi:sugar O-acyltransferase (sialic acid O-acetyltransferase NeuD family)
MKPNILLIGGGGHCKSVIDVIELENKYSIAGLIDKKELIGTKVLNYEIVGCDEDLEKLYSKYKYAIVTVGHIKSNILRIKLFEKIRNIGYKLPTIISPLAYVSKYASISDGTIIMHNALVNSNSKIGKNCIINTKSLIEHDVIIEDNCHISTCAIINGGSIVRENTFVGSNSVSKESMEVSGFIKAGSLIK